MDKDFLKLQKISFKDDFLSYGLILDNNKKTKVVADSHYSFIKSSSMSNLEGKTSLTTVLICDSNSN